MFKTYTLHSDVRGWPQRYDHVVHLMTAPGLRCGQVLAARAHLLEATALWEAALPALQRNPLYFADPPTVREQQN